MFVLAPADVPKSRFVDALPDELAKALRRHNRLRPAEEHIRLRVAVHAGEVVYDEHGVTGAAINLTFRLLEAPPVKEALAASPGSLALIVSSWYFDEVVRHSTAVDPGLYREVLVRVKETATRGWVHLPDSPVTDAIVVAGPLEARGPVPRQLPSAIRDFVGRRDQLDKLDALLSADPGPDPGPVIIAVVTGTAGAGKTTLAVRWAHRVQHRFPDGTLFANLRGYGSGPPADPGPVLTSFLRALGVGDGRIPADLEAQVGLYRSVLAGRRVLIVLDNAATPEQVRPLLPGAPGCVVLVTSRADLTGLVVMNSAQRITLDVFTESEADVLLRGIIGDEQLAADPDAVADLIAACARLPLALRVAATRIAARQTGVAEVVEGLTEGRDRLDAVSCTADDHSAVRTVFDWSYERLSGDHARTFRRIGLHVTPEFGPHAVAALTGLDAEAARRQLRFLAEMHLVAPAGRRRYRMHDLLHAYATHRAESDDTAGDRRRVVVTLLTWYAHMARSADRLIFPGLAGVEVELAPAGLTVPLADRAAALDWMSTEQANLMAALHAAARLRLHQIAMCLAGTARFLTLRGRPLCLVRLEAESVGLAAARASRNLSMEAFLLGFRGDTLAVLDRLDDADANFTQMLLLARRLDDPVRHRAALVGLGQVRLRQHRYVAARSYFQQALPLARDVRDRRAEAVVQCNLGRIDVRLGRFRSALEHAGRELVLRRAAGDRVGEAYALHNAATAWQGLGNQDTAVDMADRAIALYRHLPGTERYAALALETAAISLERTGNLRRATRCLREASTILAEFGDPRAEAVRALMRRIESRATASQ